MKKVCRIKYKTDDITWGTIVWLDSPNTISRFSRSKLTSAAYASFKPSDSIINKFSESLNELCRTGKISAEECYTLRTQPSARRILLKLTQNDESKYLDVTPLEIIKQYKQEGYNKGVEEKNEEIEQLLLQAEQAKEEANKQLKFLECQRAEEFKRANMAEIKYKMKEAEQELNDLENHKLHLLAEIEQEDKKIQNSQNGYKRCLALYRIIISLVLAFIILKLLPLIVKAQEIIEIILGFISFIAFLFGLNSNIIKDKTDWILDKCVPKCYKRNKNNKNKLESQLATLESDILASKQKINDLNKDLTNQQPKELTMV